MRSLKSLTAVTLFSFVAPAYAQQQLTEGVIEYAISINSPEVAGAEAAGTA